MLTLVARRPEYLWDDALPLEAKELPGDLAALDVLLGEYELLLPIVERRRQEEFERGPRYWISAIASSARRFGRNP